VLEDLVEGRSVFGIFLEEALDYLLEVFAVHAWDLLWPLLKDLGDETCCVFAFEWVIEASHMVDENTEGPNVDAFVVFLSLAHLW